MSHHTLLELHSEIRKAKKHKIKKILAWNTILLSLIYISVGVAPYLYFGEKIITFKYGNILLCYQFSKGPMIICNSLVIIFVIVNNILKFKPAKEIFTCLFRKNYRESRLWNVFCISLMHVVQTLIACVVVQFKIELDTICFVLAGLTVPLIALVFPFLAYYLVFYYDESVKKRRFVYLGFVFIGIFVQVSVGAYIFIQLVKGEQII